MAIVQNAGRLELKLNKFVRTTKPKRATRHNTYIYGMVRYLGTI